MDVFKLAQRQKALKCSGTASNVMLFKSADVSESDFFRKGKQASVRKRNIVSTSWVLFGVSGNPSV